MASNDLEVRLANEIAAVQQSPKKQLDLRLFEESELLLSRTLSKGQRLELVHSLAKLLEVLQQDATPVINLIIRLTEDFSYANTLEFDNIPYVIGLKAEEHYASFNRLILSILSKATRTPADAAHVATRLDTMLALVNLWLCTTDIGISAQASRLLLDLLKVDREIPPGPDAHLPSGGQGMVWKRIFGDRDIYGTIFAACCWPPPSGDLKFSWLPPTLPSIPAAVSPQTISKNQRTLAQSRVMEWLPAVGVMDWSAITRSNHEDIERTFGVTSLLEFAVLKMVDFKDDVLMYRCLIDFYSDLLRTLKPDPAAELPVHDSPALRYLIDKGVHERTVALYCDNRNAQPDYPDALFVYGPAANYVATYASSYPDHFINSAMPKRVNSRLIIALDLSPAKWAANDPPQHDLHVISSIPRIALLPGALSADQSGSAWFSRSPMSLLPSNPAIPDVMNTLSTIFRGPPHATLNFPPTQMPITNRSYVDDREAAAARALYYHYIYANQNRRFWEKVTNQARIVAMTDAAIASIGVIAALIVANWKTDPSLDLPEGFPLKDNGPAALLDDPARNYVLTYLVEPPQSFNNLVGGHGDAESAAYKVATAKFSALRLLHEKAQKFLELEPANEDTADLVLILKTALQQGPFGKEGQDAGGRIATMEL